MAGLHENGFIWFLDFVLSYVFPIIPWEIFFFIPWILVFLANRAIKKPDVKKGKMAHLILGISLFAGIYGGIAHPLGMIQAFDSLGGGEGICVVHPPPHGADPFKLYHNFADHPWCKLLALHVIFVAFVGWWFLAQLRKDVKTVKEFGSGEGYKKLQKLILPADKATAILFYKRCAVWFFVTGLSQAAPYWGVTDWPLTGRGGYSKRFFTSALVENLAAYSWIVGGLFFMMKWQMAKKSVEILDAKRTFSEPAGRTNTR